MKKSAMVLTLSVVLFAAPAWAGNWYLGAGLESVDLGDDMGIGVDTGSGFTLDFGYRFSPNFALDFLWGASYHTDDAVIYGPFMGDDFGYGRFAMGANFILVPIGPTQPYFTIGFTSHAIVYDLFPYEVTGMSLHVGGGVDIFLDTRNSIDVSVRFHSWEGDVEESGWPAGTIDATSTVITVCYNYHFLM